MICMGSLYYWFNSRSEQRSRNRRHPNRPIVGPRYAVVVNLDGSIIELDFDLHSDMQKVSQIDASKQAGVLIAHEDQKSWEGEYFNVPANRQEQMVGKDGESKKNAIARLLLTKQQAEEKERAVLADPAVHLERVLKHRDWYSHMSDDHGVWSAGQAGDRLMKELIQKCELDKVRELWKKYAPKDMNCPV